MLSCVLESYAQKNGYIPLGSTCTPHSHPRLLSLESFPDAPLVLAALSRRIALL